MVDIGRDVTEYFEDFVGDYIGEQAETPDAKMKKVALGREAAKDEKSGLNVRSTWELLSDDDGIKRWKTSSGIYIETFDKNGSKTGFTKEV